MDDLAGEVASFLRSHYAVCHAVTIDAAHFLSFTVFHIFNLLLT